MNGLALAYIGDAIYEIYIRDFLIEQGETKPNKLHHKATHYVSAKAQNFLALELLKNNMLKEEEEGIFKRGRNAKSHTFAKNADVLTYRVATGFEALMGFLHLTGQQERLEELIAWCIQKIVGEQDEERE